MPKSAQLPKFGVYGNYTGNYGAHALYFTDAMGNTYYFSYQTLVAFNGPDGRLVVMKNYWGTTTGKHLNAIDDDKKKRVGKDEFERLFYSSFGRKLEAA